MNIVKRILKENYGRDPERLAMKYRALRDSPFAFLRGTCHLFYDRLAESGFDVTAPAVWCCGDLHLENFGSYKGDNRLVYFDINDFDEAALAPASWELVRLAASMHVGLTAQGLAEECVVALVERMISQYAQTLAHGKANWIERDTTQGVVRELLDHLRERKRVDYLNSRTRVVRRRRVLHIDGRRALAISQAERDDVEATFLAFAGRQLHADFFKVLDVARRIAGTGSLGVARYVVLVEGRGSPDRNYLFDLKQAVPSTLGRQFKSLQPRWDDDAQRIVSVQERMQAVTSACLHAVTHAGAPFVLRALQPSEDRLPFDRFGAQHDLFEDAIALLARCAAWAQLRSSGRQGSANADELIAFAGKKKWQRQVGQAAAAMATQVNADWTSYADAYDTGQFQIDVEA
ncbi:DUF2252 domain-containing protein [Massilia sp. Root335]|uniref:DUF2252 domain-containing protein n=1 Tax=Massilia sp. Root335 TaxID=1736517 RepID=UPI0006F3FC6F|nr:DUF2252 family protein [Massilia sp. Root335]KQV45114.1 hypothetical protein ASC93_00725 [Massilia sp. Root335]